MTISTRLLGLTLVLGLTFCASAEAHIVFTQPQGEPKAYYAGALRVSHGCDGSPTLAIRTTLPAAVITAKPRPVAGWTVEIEREPLARPVAGEGGKVIRERVKAITWRGRLPDDQFEEFGLLVQLPDAAGPLYFPTVQTCESGEIRWTDIPPAGRPWNSAPHPAPVVSVAPANAAASAPAEAAPDVAMHHH